MFVNHVYSDTKYPYETYIRGPILKVAKGLLDPQAIYLYDRLDAATRQYQLADLLSTDVTIQLKTQPATRLLIYFPDDYLNLLDLIQYKEVLAERGIGLHKVDFIVKDKLFERFVRHHMGEDVRIYVYGPLQTRVMNFDFKEETSKKFSVFSRNYNDDRLALLLELEKRDLLKDFHYTFHNFNPYQMNFMAEDPSTLEEKYRTFTYEEMRSHAIRKNLYTKRASEWMKGIPYKIESGDIRPTLNKWSTVITDALRDSDFHVIIESHFDPFKNWKREKLEWAEGKRSIEDFSPAFPTEKTYKLLSCGRPFLAYTTPYFLKELKELGYKTFGRYINESYDKEEDDDKRRLAIVEEIQRLSKLPADEYLYIRNSCFLIAQQNMKRFAEECKNEMNDYKNGPYGEMLLDFNKYWFTLNEEDYYTDTILSHMQP